MGGLENNVSRFPDWTAISVSRPIDRDRSVTGRIDTFFQFGTREICPGVYLFHLSIHRRRFQLFSLASFHRTSSAIFLISGYSFPFCLSVKLPAHVDLCF